MLGTMVCSSPEEVRPMTGKVRSKPLFLILILMVGCGVSGGGPDTVSDSKDEGNVVSQVDHIVIRSNDADRLFKFLTETLQLPVAWPMSDFGGFGSGGVAVGNVNLEVIRSTVAGSAFTGFALEPAALARSLRTLDERGIPHGPPTEFRSGGLLGIGGKTLWTTVALPSVSGDAVEIFFCEYKDDVAARRRNGLEQLRSRKGGPLSVVSVDEIVYGAKDSPGLRNRWRDILTPIGESVPGVWHVGEGPAIRIVEAVDDGILGIVIKVRSLSEARRFLAAKGGIRESRAGEITLGGPQLEGLTVKVVQETSGKDELSIKPD
jgi:catechol 2,3-dioxygenase-like lactoylglutathione lyase family enzyme